MKKPTEKTSSGAGSNKQRGGRWWTQSEFPCNLLSRIKKEISNKTTKRPTKKPQGQEVMDRKEVVGASSVFAVELKQLLAMR